MIRDALIDVLVVAAQDRELRHRGEPDGVRLHEASAARAHQHDRPGGSERIDRFEERLRLHHHPRPAAVRIVVDSAMTVVGEVAQVEDAVLHLPCRGGARRDADRERCNEELGKDRDDVDPHSSNPSGGVTTMRRASRSTDAIVRSSKSSSTVSPSRGSPRRTSIASPCGRSYVASTTPMTSPDSSSTRMPGSSWMY